MKRWIWILVAFFGLQATAEAAGFYVPLACRDDDPFVFCTQGCKDQDKNWIPTDPVSGAWIAAPGYCPYPTTGTCCFGYVCFLPWTQTAVTAVGQYMSVCPVARKEGNWKNTDGRRPESVPYDH
ncbi:hypothetical protein OCJ37_01755 [Xanthomonas sp. AM6]|uniref:hypothetical protein n=1 Tax=Xanthomonas sp. AM6 TaxID=2982531 RepID=UPI0021DAB8F0|nr:hypothetical protein [Xanthomonas sp. AM6]UYB52716.1 hypothetical protein OCJ37_01755 [Xanthomonas sp. AM6]